MQLHFPLDQEINKYMNLRKETRSDLCQEICLENFIFGDRQISLFRPLKVIFRFNTQCVECHSDSHFATTLISDVESQPGKKEIITESMVPVNEDQLKAFELKIEVQAKNFTDETKVIGKEDLDLNFLMPVPSKTKLENRLNLSIDQSIFDTDGWKLSCHQQTINEYHSELYLRFNGLLRKEIDHNLNFILERSSKNVDDSVKHFDKLPTKGINTTLSLTSDKPTINKNAQDLPLNKLIVNEDGCQLLSLKNLRRDKDHNELSLTLDEKFSNTNDCNVSLNFKKSVANENNHSSSLNKPINGKCVFDFLLILNKSIADVDSGDLESKDYADNVKLPLDLGRPTLNAVNCREVLRKSPAVRSDYKLSLTLKEPNTEKNCQLTLDKIAAHKNDNKLSMALNINNSNTNDNRIPLILNKLPTNGSGYHLYFNIDKPTTDKKTRDFSLNKLTNDDCQPMDKSFADKNDCHSPLEKPSNDDDSQTSLDEPIIDKDNCMSSADKLLSDEVNCICQSYLEKSAGDGDDCHSPLEKPSNDDDSQSSLDEPINDEDNCISSMDKLLSDEVNCVCQSHLEKSIDDEDDCLSFVKEPTNDDYQLPLDKCITDENDCQSPLKGTSTIENDCQTSLAKPFGKNDCLSVKVLTHANGCQLPLDKLMTDENDCQTSLEKPICKDDCLASVKVLTRADGCQPPLDKLMTDEDDYQSPLEKPSLDKGDCLSSVDKSTIDEVDCQSPLGKLASDDNIQSLFYIPFIEDNCLSFVDKFVSNIADCACQSHLDKPNNNKDDCLLSKNEPTNDNCQPFFDKSITNEDDSLLPLMKPTPDADSCLSCVDKPTSDEVDSQSPLEKPISEEDICLSSVKVPTCFDGCQLSLNKSITDEDDYQSPLEKLTPDKVNCLSMDEPTSGKNGCQLTFKKPTKGEVDCQSYLEKSTVNVDELQICFNKLSINEDACQSSLEKSTGGESNCSLNLNTFTLKGSTINKSDAWLPLARERIITLKGNSINTSGNLPVDHVMDDLRNSSDDNSVVKKMPEHERNVKVFEKTSVFPPLQLEEKSLTNKLLSSKCNSRFENKEISFLKKSDVNYENNNGTTPKKVKNLFHNSHTPEKPSKSTDIQNNHHFQSNSNDQLIGKEHKMHSSQMRQSNSLNNENDRKPVSLLDDLKQLLEFFKLFVPDSGNNHENRDMTDEPVNNDGAIERISPEEKRLPDRVLIGIALRSRVGFYDAHCNLDILFDREQFKGTFADYQKFKKRTFPRNFRGCIASFSKPSTFTDPAIWTKYLNEENVWGAFGCHPRDANEFDGDAENFLCSILCNSKVKALGEIGLDYSNRNKCPREIQKRVFRKLLKIGYSRKLLLVIRCREANEDCIRILLETIPTDYTFHLHCFADDWYWAERWLKTFPNVYIGITNLVTFSSRWALRKVAEKIPLDRLLLETDAPFCIPKISPLYIEFSHPGMALHVGVQISKEKNIWAEEVFFWTARNTEHVYNL
ncbi:putative deoxyribonuclease TATDN2 [Nephila pilipes]|uniref:Putative deoxyribonuclease TATDN2 n=1 Tax=Nephila pilipes TaxID=299642 RepID=A0A8X6PNY5_NEPPI|nr:putative deoxyribonuclease TATDN2 [Nephila pilipes]